MANDSHRPTRRTLVRGAAWSVPAISVAVATPAFAASPCAKTALLPVTWSTTYTASTQTGTTAGGTNVNVTAGYTQGAGGGSVATTNLAPSAAPGTNDSITLRNNSPAGQVGNPENSYQTVNFVFTRPVYELTFFLDDIDQSTNYQDRVGLVATPVENPGRVVGSGPQVIGVGTIADPWRTSAGAGDYATGQTVQVIYTSGTIGMTSLSLRFWSNVLPATTAVHLIRLRQMQFRTCA